MSSTVLLAVDMSELRNELLRRVNMGIIEAPMSALFVSDSPESDKKDGESTPEGETQEEDTEISGDVDSEVDVQEWERLGKFPSSIAMPSNAEKINVKNVFILCNPASGARRGQRICKKAVAEFAKAGVGTHVQYLDKKGRAEEICRTQDFGDYDVLCIIGGDGTFHECVNGIMKRSDDKGKKIPLAVLPGGTGNSFVLEFFGEIRTSRVISHILRGLHCPIDICKIQFLHLEGEGSTTYSFNSLHWGLASKVNITAERLRWMGNAIRYTTAALLELINGDKTFARVTLEDSSGEVIVYEEEFCLIIANNIVTAAKGMKMAPKAKLNDGLIDLLLIRSSNTFNLANIFMKVYSGTHTDLSYVEYRQVKKFSIVPFRKTSQGLELQDDSDSDPEVCEEIIDIDGELNGLTPFECTVLPKALRVIV